MKKLSNNEAELKKKVAYKKARMIFSNGKLQNSSVNNSDQSF